MNTPVGHPRTVRILISSPGDVLEERERARQVIESLRRRYARRFVLEHVFWEDLPLQPDMSFQSGIDMVLASDGGVDIGVFILWSRLGSPLGAQILRPDGSQYRSGTEREFDLLMQAREQFGRSLPPGAEELRPDVLVYRRDDEHGFHETLRGRTTREQEECIAQKQLADAFFTREFHEAATGVNRRAYHTYDHPATFSRRLRRHLQELLEQLEADVEKEPIWDPATQGPPFVGLEAFQQRHADVFYGREEEVLDARRALREQDRGGCAFLLLCGASGSGKSSLARAGIVPAVAEYEIDEQVAAWRIAMVTPFDLVPDPVAALVARLAAAEVLPELLGEVASEDLAAVLRRNPDDAWRLQIKEAFARASRKANGPVRLLLVVDQLEELFTSAAINTRERAPFLGVLEMLARSGSVWVLATVRADFYQQVQSEPALVRMKAGAGQLDVLPPGADALRRLVEEPAHLAGLRFERRADGQSLADLILRDAAEHPELLPLIEDLLRELYERRVDDVMTFAAYAELGNSVEGALALRAERVFTSLPLEAQGALGLVLEELITVGQMAETVQTGEGSIGAEQVVRRRAVMSEFPEGTPARTMIDAFVAQRMFVTNQHPGTGVATIAVAHESLLRIWPRAVAWARDNREFLSTRAHAARRMEEGSPLLEGDPLFRAAKEHLARNPGGFPEALREYIAASVRAADEARARAEAARIWRRRKAYAALIAGVSAVVASVLFFSYRRAQDARAGQLVAEAERNLTQRDFARAEIAAARALAFQDTLQTRELVLTARSNGVMLVADSKESAPDAALTVFNLDGTLAATVVPDVASGNLAVAVGVPGDGGVRWRVPLPPSATAVDAMALSGPGMEPLCLAVAWREVVSMKSAHRVRVWTLQPDSDRHEHRDLRGEAGDEEPHTKRVPAMAFHPTKPWLATAGEDQRLCVWNLATDQPVLLWRRDDAHDTAVHGVAFNHDGSRLASCGGDYRIKIWFTGGMDRRANGDAGGAEPKPDMTLRGHTDSVFAVAFSPDGRLIASGGYDRIIRIWNLELRDEEKQPLPITIGTLSGHEGTVLTLAFSEDSRLLVSGGKDEAVRLWDVSEGRPLMTIAPGSGQIGSVVLRRFEEGLRAGGERGWTSWSVRGRAFASRFWNGGATVNAIAFDPQGLLLAAAGNDGFVRLWDRRTFAAPIALDANSPDPGVQESINGIAFSADGRWLAAAGDAGVVHVWERTADWRKAQPIDATALRHDGPVWGLGFDPSSRRLASSNSDGERRIRLWNVNDWTLAVETDPPLKDQVYSLAWIDDHHLVGGNSVGAVAIRESNRLEIVSSTENAPEGEVWSVALSYAPRSILAGNPEGRVYRWIPKGTDWSPSGQEVKVATADDDARVNPTVNSVSYSRKHGWVAAGGDGPSVEVYDANLRRIRSLRGHGGTIWYVAFDPAGSQLAYGGTDRILRLVDLDEVEALLKRSTPAEIYREAQRTTGLSVIDGRIVHGRPRD